MIHKRPIYTQGYPKWLARAHIKFDFVSHLAAYIAHAVCLVMLGCWDMSNEHLRIFTLTWFGYEILTDFNLHVMETQLQQLRSRANPSNLSWHAMKTWQWCVASWSYCPYLVHPLTIPCIIKCSRKSSFTHISTSKRINIKMDHHAFYASVS